MDRQVSLIDDTEPSRDGSDQALEEVRDWLLAHPERKGEGLDLEEIFSRAVRQAIDEVIDGARTGRYRYEELESQEKSYIGTRIEIVVRTELELEPEGKLDTVIAGHEVDFKWSAKGGWMIPTEAVNELCLLLCGDEVGGTFSVGLIRCREELLNVVPNKDSKRTISAAGKAHISWLVKDGRLPVSFLATLGREDRDAVLSRPAGQARVREFFTRVTQRPVPREVIPTLAIQEDPMRRIRSDRGGESLGGMKVLGGRYNLRREAAELLGYGPLTKRDYVSVPIAELDSLPAEMRNKL